MTNYHLKNLKNFKKRTGPVVLLIMDGVGIKEPYDGNAVFLANPVHLNRYMKESKEKKMYAELKAHGPAVGLPTDQDMGNSEVGHNALGSGQIFFQGAKLVNTSLQNGQFFQTDVWKNKVAVSIQQQKTIHFIGLLSDGNVHSHIDQLFLMLDGCVKSGAKSLRIHPLLDGRDVPPLSGLEFIEKLEHKLLQLRELGVDAKIASGGGRMAITMDRYGADWSMVEAGLHTHVYGKIEDRFVTSNYSGYFKSAKEAIIKARELWPDKKDQYNPPFVIVDDANNPIGSMNDGDTVINFNFRGDRAIELSECFDSKTFDRFDRGNMPKVHYAGLLEYDSDRKIPLSYLVVPPSIDHVCSQYLCEMNVSSYAIAETHKFGHVTYFWNGNRSGYICKDIELYEEITSDPSEMIESKPEMKAKEVTDRLLAVLDKNEYQTLRVNLANGDMVGHTGNMKSCIKSMQVVDECVERIVQKVIEKQGVIIITADHGNVEEKQDKKGQVITSHSLNPVPFMIIDSQYQGEYHVETSHIKEAGIANVTATYLNLLGFEAPSIYEASLLKFKD